MLRRDAASILHRHPRSMFANRLLTAAVNVTTPSTPALAWPGSTLIVRVCTERTNACATVSTKKSYSELPYKLPTLPLLINPPPLHPPRNPEYWYSRLQPGSMWMRPFELYFLHVQYNFKQLPLCESCCPECWQELLISLVLFLNIFFWIVWAASSFLSFFSFFFFF